MWKKTTLGRSHSGLYPVTREQLFTELTPQEAALIEGGSVVRLETLYTFRAGADGPNDPDDIYILVNGQDVGFFREMRTNEVTRIDKFVNFLGFATIELYDRDMDEAQFIDSFTIPAAAVASEEFYLRGSGSEYAIQYWVIP